MTLRSEIREALVSGPHTAAMIVEVCDSVTDEKQAAQNLHVLANDGKIKKVGTIAGRASYALADWPLKESNDNAPPPKRAGRKAKAMRARPAEAPAPMNGDASADQFAITDTGVLAIKQGEIAIQIYPESFARLRKFIDRADSIINPSE